MTFGVVAAFTGRRSLWLKRVPWFHKPEYVGPLRTGNPLPTAKKEEPDHVDHRKPIRTPAPMALHTRGTTVSLLVQARAFCAH